MENIKLTTENQSINTWLETPSLKRLVLAVLHCTDGDMLLLTVSQPSSVYHTEHTARFDIYTSSVHMEGNPSSVTILHNDTEHLKKYMSYTNITNASFSHSIGSYWNVKWKIQQLVWFVFGGKEHLAGNAHNAQGMRLEIPVGPVNAHFIKTSSATVMLLHTAHFYSLSLLTTIILHIVLYEYETWYLT